MTTTASTAPRGIAHVNQERAIVAAAARVVETLDERIERAREALELPGDALRVRWPEQRSWVRATRSQAEQAAGLMLRGFTFQIRPESHFRGNELVGPDENR